MALQTTIIGCGWVGLPLANRLIDLGYSVHGSTSSIEKIEVLEAHSVLPFVYSLEENTRLDSFTSETELLILTIPPIRREEYTFYGDHLRKLVNQFSNVKKVVFLSSIGIYPKRSSIYFEDFEFLESESKNSLYWAEHQLEEALGDKLIIMRLGGLFGPGRHPALSLQGRQDVVNPNGVINLVHQNDVINALIHLVDADSSGIYNVVYPEHPWRKEYYTHVYRKYGLKPINFIISPTIEKRVDTTKITSDTGYKFQYSIYKLEQILLN